MNNIKIKPLSVNEAWKGRRFKSNTYKLYEKELLYTLPPLNLPHPPFEIQYEFGFSSVANDVDNPIKPFQDILCKKYNFDDKDIKKITATKCIVAKGCEYIKYKIKHFDINL